MTTAVFPSIAYPRPAASTARTRAAVFNRAPETAPVTLKEFESDGQTIQLKNSLVLYPLPDETGQYLWVREKGLGLDVYAPTRAALVNEIKSELAFLWEEYALSDDDGLTPDARALKQNLLAAMEASNG